MNISSIVVQTLPKYLDSVIENLKNLVFVIIICMMKKVELLLQLKVKM